MKDQTQLKAADGSLVPAYIATPSGPLRGAIVVLQEIFGVNHHIRAVADRFAAKGYLAVAPATFHRVEPGVELGYSQQDMSRGIALKSAAEALPGMGILQDIEAAVDFAAGAGKVGIIGFCWGGLLAWRAAAALHGLSAAVIYYGGGVTSQKEMARRPRVPTICHFGEYDHYIPVQSVEAFRASQPLVECHLYPADHGFNCDERAAWSPEQAGVAWTRTLDHFQRYVG